jgi:hypothetical protein
MRIIHTVCPQISDDTDGKHTLFGLDEDLIQSTIDGMTEVSSGRAVLPIAAFTVPMGPISSCKGAYLRAEGDFDLAINGGAAIQVRRPQKGTSAADLAAAATFFIEANISSLVVTPIAVNTVLFYALFGDPLA